VEHKLAADYGAFEAIWKSITATQVADFMNKSRVVGGSSIASTPVARIGAIRWQEQ